MAGGSPATPPDEEDVAPLSLRQRLAYAVGGGIAVVVLIALGFWAGHAAEQAFSDAPPPVEGAASAPNRPVGGEAAAESVPVVRPEAVLTQGGDAVSGSAAKNEKQAPTAGQENKLVLPKAPDPAVAEQTPEGILPKIAEDGSKPWQVYSRPFQGDARPRVAIVLGGIGVSPLQSNSAIARLPGEVTLAMEGQGPELKKWVDQARAEGHEVILSLPMEPFDYPRSDPGRGALLSHLANSENILRLNAVMRRAVGYVGVTTLSGSKFTTMPDAMKIVLEELDKRGLLFFDAKVASMSVAGDLAHARQMPHAQTDIRLDREQTPAGIREALAQLEQKAEQAGKATGFAIASPLIIEQLGQWTQSLPQKHVVLAPISAVVE